MKNNMKLFLAILLMPSILGYCQAENRDKYYFDFTRNAERLSGSDDSQGGLLLYFKFWNKDEKTGNGGGWLIHKRGTLETAKLANEFYPEKSLKGIMFVNDILQIKNRNPNVDTNMLRDFDIYLYIVSPQYLEKRLNTDGEGAGKTYSYYETYPLYIDVFKQSAGQNYFLKVDTYHAKNEDEYFESKKKISDFKKKTVIESNL